MEIKIESRDSQRICSDLGSYWIVYVQLDFSNFPIFSLTLTEYRQKSYLYKSVETYVRSCEGLGVSPSGWRSPGFCPMECGGGMVYQECGVGTSPTCSDSGINSNH